MLPAIASGIFIRDSLSALRVVRSGIHLSQLSDSDSDSGSDAPASVADALGGVIGTFSASLKRLK
jgi:hypothetical protein